MRTFRFALAPLVATCLLAGYSNISSAQTLTETFPDPLGGWTSRWLYQHSNMDNYYVVTGTGNEDYRGNNPDGLWFADTKGVNSGASGSVSTITFDTAFAASLTSLSFDLSAFVNESLTIYDKDSNILLFVPTVVVNSNVAAGQTYSVTSSNGIGSFRFDSTSLGGAQIEGNTAIDNIIVNVSASPVPEPGSIALFIGMSLSGAGFLARRRKNARQSA